MLNVTIQLILGYESASDVQYSDWSGSVYTEEKVSMYSRPGLLEDMATS